tara:strand:+ start:1426 stop:2640 length:1215 start_codon:yes stop_codon:yes gene_type:complete
MSNKEIKVQDDVICCAHTGDYHPEDEMIEVDGCYYHDDIISEVCCVPYAWDDWVLKDECVYSEIWDDMLHRDDVSFSYHDDVLYSDEASEYDYYWIERGIASDYYLHRDYAIYCEDIEEDVHQDDAHYCDVDDCSYYDEDNCRSNIENEYEICQYHNSPEPDDISKNAQFRIGFEIEKTSFAGLDSAGEEVGCYDIFKGYELDSSCGVEAITHILPLSGVRSKRRADLFKMMDKAKWIVNSEYNGDCGGHITISWKGHTYESLLDKVNYNLCILYALYRKRLKNSFCQNNKNLKDKTTERYSVVKYNDRRYNQSLEIRLPNAVKNIKQLKLRYDLIFQILNHSINSNDSYDKLWKKVEPIILKMYSADVEKVKYIKRLSKMFRQYLITGMIDPEINEFINNTNN